MSCSTGVDVPPAHLEFVVTGKYTTSFHTESLEIGEI